ncbi:MAG: hypothetical protein ACREMY_22415, partial [bacterium]
AMMGIVMIPPSAVLMIVPKLSHWLSAFSLIFNDLGGFASWLFIVLNHFQLRISGRSSSCLSM